MEDFIGIIVLVVIWLVAASGRKGKKAEKPRAQRQKEQKARMTSFEQAFARRVQAEQKGAPAQQPVSPAPVREPDCERRPIHLHEATQHQMAQAAEGEDPCHSGSAPQEPSPIFEPEHTQADIYPLPLTGEADPVDLRALYEALKGRFFGLTLRDETTPRRDLWAGCEDDTLRGLFLRALKSQYDAAQSEQARQTVALAARYGVYALEERTVEL